ncbi:MAG: translocation/assembly module TamB domain-containing protein [Bacteroidia bacterium]
MKIDKVKISFFDRAEIEGFYVEDLHQDTLLYLQYLEANFDDVYLGFSHFDFDKVVLRNGQFNVRQFQGEDDLNIQFILDKINPPRGPNDTIRSAPPELFFWNVDFEGIDFTYEYRDSIVDTTSGLNQDLIRIRNIHAHMERFLLIDDSLSGDIRKMSFTEANGFEVKNMQSEFIVAYTTMDFANLKLQTTSSSLVGKFHFDYDNYGELSDFIEEVQMRGSIRSSSIDLNELSYFSNELKGLNKRISLIGDFKGRVDNLIGRNVEINLPDESRFIGNLAIQGLPDTDQMTFQIEAKEISTTSHDLNNFPLYPFYKNELLSVPKEIDALGEIKYTGKLSGSLDDVQIDGVLLTDAGDVDSHIRFWYDKSLKDYAYEGDFSTPNLMLDKLVKSNPQPGLISMEANIQGSGFSTETLSALLVGSISEFTLDNYTYQDITLNGNVSNKTYDGRLKINDKNIRLTFAGLLDLSQKRAVADFNATIDHLDLEALGYLKKDSSLIISTIITSSYTGNNIDELDGQIELAETSVRYGKTKYLIDDILLESHGDYIERNLSLLSDIADVELKGKYKIAKLPDAISGVLNSFLPSFTRIKADEDDVSKNQSFDYDITIKNLDLISAIFFPDIKVEGPTNINGRFDSGQNLIKMDAISPMVSVAGIEFSRFKAGAFSEGSGLKLFAGANRMNLDDSVHINHVYFDSRTITDNIEFTIDWASKTTIDAPDAKLNAKAVFSGSKIEMNILPSLILIEDTLWKVNEENTIVIDTGLVIFDNLSFVHLNEFVRLDGKISSDTEDELDIILDNFQLRNINPFIENNGIKLQGSTKGIISVSNLLKKPFFKSDLLVKGIYVNNDLIGDGKILSKWDREAERIILDIELSANGIPKLVMNGYYIPSKKENNINITASMNNIQMDLFKPYVTDLFSDMSGLVDGKLTLTGSLFKPVAVGTITLKRAAVTVDILNTRYFLAHEFEITKNLIQAKDVVITDENAHTGRLDLKIKHDYFNDFEFDINLLANNLMALNTNETQSDLFYGQAYATGTFSAKGPLDNIVMNISAKTEKGTTFYLPLSETGDISQQDFITFVSSKNDTLKASIPVNQLKSKGYELNFNLEVTPDAEALLLFDPKVGDMIKGNGRGNLRLEVTEAGEFNIYGDYIIDSGDYLFTLQNVINKKFVVQKGGVISFKGDPYDADIQLAAIYRVRTSLYNLVKNIDSSSAVKRAIDVDAVMNLSDKLMKPTISFNLVLPNADEDARNLLASQITNEDELNRQIFALVMFRNFWPNQGGAGDASGLNGVGSNASELLSSQLSNMLSQLSDDVNIGVNYSQGNADTRDQVSVNLSTQIFNDRVSIDGNVGTAGTAANTENTSNMVGEFNIEVKLTEDGAVRIKVFNRSNQYLLVTNDVPYTQGVGLFYRKEAETFGELFKKQK